MKTSSAKAKGRRCAQEARDLLLRWAPDLEAGDVVVTPSGVTGPDLQLSPAAKKVYPFAVECKNKESLNIWAALAQACDHVRGDEMPVLFFRRNRSNLYVAIPAEAFMQLAGVIDTQALRQANANRAPLHNAHGDAAEPHPAGIVVYNPNTSV